MKWHFELRLILSLIIRINCEILHFSGDTIIIFCEKGAHAKFQEEERKRKNAVYNGHYVPPITPKDSARS